LSAILGDLAGLAANVDDLRPLPGNPRRGDVAAVARSLHAFGQRKPIVARRDGTVIAGNHTLAAAKSLGWDRIAVVRVDDDDATAKAYSLADNRTAELGGYDEAELATLIGEVQDADVELLAATGWTDADLDALLAKMEPEVLPTALSDPDDVPQMGAKPVSAVGDVWQLGPHRLAVGDSTDVGVWDRLLGGSKADMVWTDPPYGVSYVGKTADALTIENDGLDEGELGEFLRAAFGAALTATKPGAAWYVAGPAGPLHLVFGNLLHELGVLRQTLIWVKDQFVMGRSDYHYRHEPIYYGWSPGAAHRELPDRTQDSVFEIARPKSSKLHPTMKPVELISTHIANSATRDGIVVDPFGGSGSTLIAAHVTGRVARLIELDPRYADVICRRYQEHTGTKPVRDGAPYDFAMSDL
jgi:site-specific DNA-methyltransferase (adenine-specific)